ncbi:hypothetical protein LAZ67_15000052 [Cordylochernes scorpioides]|uniref:Uncharacterized protein n=1 Tax=Cordylochernes scorpioides TaxID=51811 RepID=A0ABY6L7S7_9ARAC|nr:hypothetical protein LAZ67_15000052 [Cordylochernes scorpioides]
MACVLYVLIYERFGVMVRYVTGVLRHPDGNSSTRLTYNMPRRSRPLIGRNTAASRRYRNAIAIETPLQSETRRALRRLRYSEARVAAAKTMQVPVQRIQLWTHKPFSGLQYNTHIDYKADSSVDIGQMSRVCQFCSALRFRDEPFGLCCKQENDDYDIAVSCLIIRYKIISGKIFQKAETTG